MLFSKLEKHINNTTKIFSFASAFIGALLTLAGIYGFFYDEVKTVKTHGQEITSIKNDVKEINSKINTTDIIESGNRADFKALQDKVASVEKTIDKIDSKLDRVLFQTK